MTTANLKPAFKLTVYTDGAVPIYTNSSTALTVVKVARATTETLDPEFPFDSEIFYGSDDLRTNPTGEFTNLDCKMYGKTKNGKNYTINFGGVMRPTGIITEVLAHKRESMEFSEGYLWSTIFIRLDDSEVETPESWVTKTALVGDGRFFWHEGKLAVQYIVNALL